MHYSTEIDAASNGGGGEDGALHLARYSKGQSPVMLLPSRQRMSHWDRHVEGDKRGPSVLDVIMVHSPLSHIDQGYTNKYGCKKGRGGPVRNWMTARCSRSSLFFFHAYTTTPLCIQSRGGWVGGFSTFFWDQKFDLFQCCSYLYFQMSCLS